jgi:hypothetical protein
LERWLLEARSAEAILALEKVVWGWADMMVMVWSASAAASEMGRIFFKLLSFHS